MNYEDGHKHIFKIGETLIHSDQKMAKKNRWEFQEDVPLSWGWEACMWVGEENKEGSQLNSQGAKSGSSHQGKEK